MAKVLRCVREEACIGCGLCILTASRIMNSKFSLADSCVRVIRCLEGKKLFSVKIDQGACRDIEEIVNICPQRCFAIFEESKIEE